MTDTIKTWQQRYAELGNAPSMQTDLMQIEIEQLRAALAQQAEQGWVRVPVEPTQSMLRALINEWDSVGGKSMYENYKAMLAAAPKGGV